MVAVLGATSLGEAASNAVRATFAQNAGKLAGFAPSKKAKKNTVVVRGANGKIDRTSLPLTRGPRGPAGPAGSAGPAGATGPAVRRVRPAFRDLRATKATEGTKATLARRVRRVPRAPTGAAGTARAYAFVNGGASPTFDAARTMGFDLVTNPGIAPGGVYCIRPAASTGIAVTKTPLVVSADFVTTQNGGVFIHPGFNCPAGQFEVITADSAGTRVNTISVSVIAP